jgi:hypothetical protein
MLKCTGDGSALRGVLMDFWWVYGENRWKMMLWSYWNFRVSEAKTWRLWSRICDDPKAESVTFLKRNLLRSWSRICDVPETESVTILKRNLWRSWSRICDVPEAEFVTKFIVYSSAVSSTKSKFAFRNLYSFWRLALNKVFITLLIKQHSE